MSRALTGFGRLFAFGNHPFGNLVTRFPVRNFSQRTVSAKIPKEVQKEYFEMAQDQAISYRFPIFNPEKIAKGAQNLENLLRRHNGDDLLHGAEDFVQNKINSIFIPNSVPRQEYYRNLTIGDRHIRTLSQNDPWIFANKMQLLGENFPNSLFLTHYMRLCDVVPYQSSGMMMTNTVPTLMLLDTINSQPPHTDGKTFDKPITMIAITAYDSNGQIPTMVLDVQEILNKLSPHSLDILLQAEFTSDEESEKKIRVFQFDEKGQIGIKYKFNLQAVSGENYEQSMGAFRELNQVIADLYQNKVQKFALRTGQTVLVNNERVVHNRGEGPAGKRLMGIMLGSRPEKEL